MDNLGERKKLILRAIIDDYIELGEPVGSRTLSKKHLKDISSATIRNEMADLEELGFLKQPHTSAGRIPSAYGYRLYVDQLMDNYMLTVDEITKIQEVMEFKYNELDRLIQEASKVISSYTNYTTVAITPEITKISVKRLELLLLAEQLLLLIVITNLGIIKNKLIKTVERLNAEFVSRLSKVLNEKLCGLTLEELTNAKISEILRTMEDNLEDNCFVVFSAINFIYESIQNVEYGSVFLGGAFNMLNYPEYRDLEKAKPVLNFLEKKAELSKLLTSHKDDNIKVIIGEESEFEELKDCSVILANYAKDGDNLGTIGIIGPTRMVYSKVMSSLKYLVECLNKALDKL